MDADNTFVGVVVPASIVASLVEKPRSTEAGKRAKSASELCKEFVEGLLAEYVAQGHLTPPVVPDPPALTLDDASAILLNKLNPEHKLLIQELAAESHRPISAYILSPVMLAKDHGTVGVLVGEWADVPEAAQVPNAPRKQGACEECSKPVKAGTRFCPPIEDGAEGCGHKHARRMRQEMVERSRPQQAPSPFAPKPSPLTRAFAAANAEQPVS